MEPILRVALSNAAVATVLALLALTVSRLARRPALTHCLWLLVLVKLVTPPLFSVPIELPAYHVATHVERQPTDDVAIADFATVMAGMPHRPMPGDLPPEEMGDVERWPAAQAARDEPMASSGTELKVVETAAGMLTTVPVLPEPVAAEDNAEDLGPYGSPPSAARAEDGRDALAASFPHAARQQVEVKQATNRFSATVARMTAWLADVVASVLPTFVIIWASGSFLWFALAASRLYRFNRLLRHAWPASSELQREANQLSWRLGLEEAPQVCLVHGAISPMLWAFSGRARIIFPSELLHRLDVEARRSLLLHELAHYRRRDHLVRLLEFVVTGLYWWHPVVWWSLREIHTAEEDCCDAWVVSEYWPAAEDRGQRTVYARALVDTIQYLSEIRAVMPPAASGIGRMIHLRRRLTAILSQHVPRELSPRARLLVAALAIAIMPWLPAFGQATAKPNEPATKAETPDEAASSPAKPTAATSRDAANPLSAVTEPIDFVRTAANFVFVSRNAWSGQMSPDGKYLVAGYGHWTEAGEVRVWEVATGKVLFEFPEPKGVRSVAFSPDGKRFASGNFAGEIKLRDVETGEIKFQFTEDAGSVDHLSFSADGQRLATASNGKVARIWDIAEAKIVQTFTGHGEVVYTAEFSPDGKSLVTSSRDRTSRVWDIASGKMKHSTSHPNQVIAARYSPDGQQIATGCFDGRLRLLDAASGKVLATLQGHQQYVTALSYSPDGKLLVTGAKDGAIVFWDPKSHKRLATVVAHADELSGLSFSRDSKQLISTSWDKKTVKVWDVATRKTLKTFSPEDTTAGKPLAVLALGYSPGGTTVAAVMEDHSILLRDATTANVRHVLRGHDDYVLAVAFSPDGKTLASVSYDRLVKLWDVQTGREKHTFAGHKGWAFAVAFSPDGKRLASGGYDRTVRLWDVAKGGQMAVLETHTAAVRGLAFSPDGMWLASCSSDNTIKLFDAATLKEQASWKAHKGTVRAIAFSPDSKSLASGGEDNLVKLWEVPSGKPRATLTAHSNMVWCLAFSPKGKTLASGGSDNVIRLWDPATGAERGTLQGHSAVITSLAFAPDTSRLLSGSVDRSIKVWKIKRPPVQPLSVLNADAKEARFVIFSPDGKLMITSGSDASVNLWDTRTGKLSRTLSGHRSGVIDGAVTRDGKVLATGDYTGIVRLWELGTGKPVAALKCGTAELMTVEFSPDGKRLLVAGWDKTASMWDVATREMLWRTAPQSLPVTCATFHPEGKLIATTSGNWREWRTNGEVKLWSADAGKELYRLRGHSRKIRRARFSPDGTLLATCGADMTIRIWVVGAMPMLKTVIQAPAEVSCLTFVRGGKAIAAGMHGGGVGIWDLGTGQRVIEYLGHAGDRDPFQITTSPDGSVVATAGGDVRLWPTSPRREAQRWTGHAFWVHGATFSPDGRLALTTRGPGSSLRLWEVKTGKEIRRFAGHTRGALCAAFSPDGTRAISGGQDNTMRLWDVASGKALRAFAGHTKQLRGVAFSPDGRHAASASEDGTIRLWDLESGRAIATIEPGAGDVLTVEFSPDGRRLLAASKSAAVLWRLPSGEAEDGPIRQIAHPSSVLCARFDAEATRILTGCADGVARLWDAKTGKLIRRFAGHTDAAKSVAFLPDGQRMLTAGHDGVVLLWDLRSGEILQRLLGHESRVLTVEVSRDGRWALTGGEDRTARLWDLTAATTDKPTLAATIRTWRPEGALPTATLRLNRTLKAHTGGVWFVRYAPQDKLIATGGRDKLVRLWDSESLKQIAGLKGHTGQVICGAFAPEGKLLVTGSTDKTVRFWDVDGRSSQSVLTAHGSNVRMVSFSPDGKRLATASEDRTVIVWDVAVRKVLYKIELPLPVYNVAFSPDGKSLATTTGDYRKNQRGDVRLFDAATGNHLRTLAESQGVSMGLAFSPNGQHLAARNSFLATTVWNTATGKPRLVIHRLRGIRPLAFSPDGQRLAGGSSAHSGFLWVANPANGHLIAEAKGHDKLIFSLTFSPDGKTLASASEDGTVKFWSIDSPK